jgi:undecaprenyl-diphosphatase
LVDANRPDREETPAPRRLVRRGAMLTAIAFALLFALLTWNVVANVGLARLDPNVQAFVLRNRVGWLTEAFRVLTWLGSTAVLVPLVVAFGAIVLWRQRDLLSAFLPGTALLVTVLAKNSAKFLIGRPRPSPGFAIGSNVGSAFPSGHSADSLAVFAMLALVVASGRTPRAWTAIWGGAAIAALVVGVSRVYLGAHWMTDVLGGWALAGGIVSILVAVFGPGRRSGPEAEALTPPVGPART